MTHNDEYLTPFTSDSEDDLGSDDDIKTTEPEEEEEDTKTNMPGGNDDANFEPEEF